jgi:hypothetical protein
MQSWAATTTTTVVALSLLAAATHCASEPMSDGSSFGSSNPPAAHCIDVFRPLRRCASQLCVQQTDDSAVLDEHDVPDDVEGWWERTATAGRCVNYVWESFSRSEAGMAEELGQHIIFHDREAENRDPSFVRDLVANPHRTVCESLKHFVGEEEEKEEEEDGGDEDIKVGVEVVAGPENDDEGISGPPGLCWIDDDHDHDHDATFVDSGRFTAGGSLAHFTVIGNSHSAVWEFGKQRLRNEFSTAHGAPPVVRGATAYGLGNASSASGAHGIFRGVIEGVNSTTSAAEAANRLLVVQLGQVDVDSLLGLRRRKRDGSSARVNELTVAEQVNASVANLVRFLADTGARWRFRRVVFVGLNPPALGLDDAWIDTAATDEEGRGFAPNPAFRPSDPEVALKLTQEYFTTGPWRVRRAAAEAFNDALRALAARDPHGIFAYVDVNDAISSPRTGRLHREYTHLLMANTHLRDDRTFPLLVNGLAAAVGLRWCGRPIEARCRGGGGGGLGRAEEEEEEEEGAAVVAAEAMRAAGDAGRRIPVHFVAQTGWKGKPEHRFWEVERNYNYSGGQGGHGGAGALLASGGDLLRSLGAAVDVNGLSHLLRLATGLFGPSWQPEADRLLRAGAAALDLEPVEGERAEHR